MAVKGKEALKAPSLDALTAAFREVLNAIEAEVKALEARLGPSGVALVQVEAIIQRALDDFNWNSLKDVVRGELLALILTGRSVVKDDDTDIA